MTLEQLIRPDSVLCNANARSKKHCLEILSELLARVSPEIGSDEIFAKLIERERLGCTSLDKGTALPHCRVPGVEHSSGALIKLVQPVEFDSPDGEDVDLVFGLMVPGELDESHHSDIALIAGLMRDESLRSRLREASTSKALYEALVTGQGRPEPRLRTARNA
jgi:PTS system nitrogen regulatory IIA component